MAREKIKSLRKLRNLSQAALGQLANLTAPEISRIECGYRDVSPTERAAIALALGVKPADLDDRPGMTSPPTHAPGSTPPMRYDGPAGLSAATKSANGGDTRMTKPLPTGSDLNDPANFGQMPDLALLKQGSLDSVAYQTRLAAEIAHATKILHTSRIPAAVWRAWREFERQATELLRVSKTSPGTVRTAPAPRATTAPAAAPAKPQSKSFNALFVDAARSILSPEVVDRLNVAAEESKKNDPATGFMKYFRQHAENDLSPDVLEQIRSEANRRLAPRALVGAL